MTEVCQNLNSQTTRAFSDGVVQPCMVSSQSSAAAEAQNPHPCVQKRLQKTRLKPLGFLGEDIKAVMAVQVRRGPTALVVHVPIKYRPGRTKRHSSRSTYAMRESTCKGLDRSVYSAW